MIFPATCDNPTAVSSIAGGSHEEVVARQRDLILDLNAPDGGRHDVRGLQKAGCPLNGVWKWGGTASGWLCRQDLDTNSGGDITAVIAGTGLTGGGHLGSVTLSLAETPVTQDAAGYARTPLTASTPPAADCDAVSETGRTKHQASTDTLYVCDGTGWRAH